MRRIKAGDVLKKYKGLKSLCSSFISIIIIIFAVVSVCERLPQCFSNEDVVVAAATLTMSKGSYDTYQPTQPTATETTATESKTQEKITALTEFDKSYYNTSAHKKNDKKFPIYTRQYNDGETQYGNFYVKNSTNFNLNISNIIKKDLSFSLDDTKDVQVLIYHTHTSEAYIDKDVGYYYSDYYPRTEDNRYNVTRVGEEIANELRKAGIGVVHDTTIHDRSYNGSYSRSRATVEENLKKYPNIKVTLDIHRDSIGDDTYKIKPTYTYNGKKGAQIMIMSGYDENGYYDFPNWKDNLNFALKLQEQCESKYKGITRPLYFGNFAYNMNINSGSLLVEFGTEANTLDEAVYSGKLFGKALVQVLQNNS